MGLPEVPPSSTESFFKKHRNLLLASLAIIIFVVIIAILVVPIVPVQYTVAKTETRNFLSNAGVYSRYGIPNFVNVTNEDSLGGSFSITMDMWYNPPLEQSQLLNTSTQSAFIQAGASHAFHLPSNWTIWPIEYSFTYSVSPPTKQIYYNVKQTKYESILTLIENSLG